MKYTLDPHQIHGVKYTNLHPYTIVAFDMGLGKSLTALASWERSKGHLLIVCPSYLVLNWQSEIKKFFGDKYIVTLIRKGKEIYEIFDSDIVIISYDLSQKSEQVFEWADVVILDEGQELKSMKAKRTEYIHRTIFENSIKRLMVLTGTPIKNRVEEYYSLIALMNYDPKLKGSDFLEKFPDSITFADYFSHRKEFTMEINGRWVTIVKWEGVRKERIPELKKYLKGHYIRYTAEQVLKLDKPRFIDVLVSDVNDKKLLAEFENHYSQEDSEKVGPSAKAEAALKTAPFTVQYCKKLLEEVGCVAIYSDHVEAIKYRAAAFNVPAITGEMPSARRLQLGREFQEGKSNVIAATIKSFSTGISLTRAKDLVKNDPSWVPGDNNQTYARIHRRDQTHAVRIHRMLGSPQAKYIYDALEEKNLTINEVV